MMEISDVDAVQADAVALGIVDEGSLQAGGANLLVRQLRRRPGVDVYDLDMESLDGTQEYIMLFRDLLEFAGVEFRPRRTRIHKSDDQPRTLSMTFQWQGQEVEWHFDHTPGWVSDEFLEQALSLLKAHSAGRLHCLLTDDAYAYFVLLKSAL